jgi:uncharacterized protein (TIGR02271 family)
MALTKLDTYYPDYKNHTDGNDIKSLDVYAQGDKVGSVQDVLVDERDGKFRYLVVDTGFWVLGKKVLLPIGLANIDYAQGRVNVSGLTKQQVENLPEFTDNLKIDQDYEENVRGVYRPIATGKTATASTTSQVPFNRDTYDYKQDAALYDLNEHDHQTLRLYEERLIANKQRQKTGEVTVGKHVETQTAKVSVPVEKERVVIERSTPTGAGTPVAPGEATFQEGTVAHVDIYEERADVHKEAFVREQVNIRKEVEHDTVTAEEQIRREELDIDDAGRGIVDQGTTKRDRL